MSMSTTSVAAPVRPLTGSPSGDTTPRPEPKDRTRPLRAGPTLLAAAAVLAGASALTGPISGHTWVPPMIEMVAVIWLAGIGGRLLGFPAVGTALLQLGGFLTALTSLFTSGGIGGVLPSRAAVAEAGQLLTGALAQITGTAAPTPATPELGFLVALSVGSAALIADILVTVARSPALVGLPLLSLYAVPASLTKTMLPWYSFAGPAVLYAALLAATGQQERRAQGRARIGFAVHGGAVIASATAAALVIAGSVPILGTEGRLPHTRSSTNFIGLSPFAALQGSLRNSTPVPVLTATGLSAPDYFRTVALTAWTTNRGWSLGPVSADVVNIDGPLSAVPLAAGTSITVRTQNFQDRFLPILAGTSAITGLADRWNFDATLNTVYRADSVKPGQYLLRYEQRKPTVTDLRADSVDAGSRLIDTGALDQSVRDTAQRITGAASGPFDKANALQRWFTDPASGFRYSLDVPADDRGDALVSFLTHKKGFCQQYAAAMAIMLRSLNIPSRVVIGFTQGSEQPDGSYLVTSHNAHAWVEVQFQRNGWVRFDPTPPVAGQGGQQGFSTTAAAPAATSPAVAAPPVPVPAPRVNGPDGAQTAAPATKTAPATAAETAAPGTFSPAATAVILAVAAAIAALLLLPAALRYRRRRRRLARAGSGEPGAAGASWTELEDTAIDHRIGPQPGESARMVANRLARHAHLVDADRARLHQLVLAAEREWYDTAAHTAPARSAATARIHDTAAAVTIGDHRAGPGNDGALLAASVRSVVRGLHRNAAVSWAGRILPRSLRQNAR